MSFQVKLLPGLPPYGPLATPFPSEWGRVAREGTVVEFKDENFCWVGNFRPGLGGITLAAVHPNKRDAVVIARGDLWIVDPVERTASSELPAIEAVIEVDDGWLFSRQGLAIARFGPEGLRWHTKRLSWDGLDDLQVIGDELTGLALDLTEKKIPFRINIHTGRSSGGSFLEEGTLTSDWERLADD